MQTQPLGTSSLSISRLGYGCWRIAAPYEGAEPRPDRLAHGREAVIAAYEAGYTLFDLADVYADGMSETLFGEVLRDVSGMRESVVVASKCGVRKANQPHTGDPYRYDFSKEYVVRSCEDSLQRLGIERLDLYQLHRPDFLGDPNEIAAAFSQLHDQGKVLAFGVSNCRTSLLSALQKHCPMPLVANQVEISLIQLAAFHDGVLDQCLGERITPMAWSPLGGGRLVQGGSIELNDPHCAKKAKLRETMDHVGRELGCSRTVVSLAWLLRHPSGIVPLVGSTNPENIRDATRAVELNMSREVWYRLFEAALGHRLP